MRINNFKTFSAKTVQRDWLLIDATNLTLGRLASQIAIKLMGKDKTEFTYHMPTGSNIIVINASKIQVTGKKLTDKMYYHHTNFPKGLRKQSYQDIVNKDPCLPLYKAVKGMLPKNKLADVMLRNLKIYQHEKHQHEAQKPTLYQING